jgi:nucleotide-binding universal stress UspA family protein
MPSASSSSYTILAAVDYSDTASLVVQEAVDLARQKHAAALHFLHVNQLPVAQLDDAGQEARHAELLEWLGARLKGSQGLAPDTKVIGHEASGDPASLIVEMAGDVSADAVVVGTHGRKGVQRLLLGSVAAAVVKNCGCPVLVVRPKHHEHAAVQIEPACPRCLAARAESQGKSLWCEQHTQTHGRRHTYYDPRAASWVNQRMMS